MNTKSLFTNFNPCKFLVFSSLLAFSLLFALRLDKAVVWSYWVVFTPIWIWKVVMVCGAAVGIYAAYKNPAYRSTEDSRRQFHEMLMSTGLHLLLTVFEILACDNLENKAYPWIYVFIPAVFLSLISVSVCTWAVKNERPFQLELFYALNILQFSFLPLRLDGIVMWSWLTVFIPIWIMMCVMLVGMLYVMALAVLFLKSSHTMPEHVRRNVCSAIGYSLFIVPLLVFEVLLANRLDGSNNLSYTSITVPLLLALATLTCLSFNSKGSNIWWFGIQKDFWSFLLDQCPCLQEYGNISYSLQRDDVAVATTAGDGSSSADRTFVGRPNRQLVNEYPVVPVVLIETPD